MVIICINTNYKWRVYLRTTVAKTLAILDCPEIRDTVERLVLAKHVPCGDATCHIIIKNKMNKNRIDEDHKASGQDKGTTEQSRGL